MHTRFLHAADIHLGYEQYNLPERADDFARAFMAVVEQAIATPVDFVLLAGDLFHRASADAWMLTQATHCLQELRHHRIPVIAVEGNHDAQHAQKSLSWMEYLANQSLLVLLNVAHSPGGHVSLVPWNEQDARGSWIDLAGARIYGIKYYGARTGHMLEQVHAEIEPGPEGYTILMLHAGIQGQVPHLHGGLTPGQLAPWHPPVDYLALGHVHHRLEMDGWIYNPGSTETNSMEEIDWPHGFFEVEVDTSASPKHRVRAIPTPGLRPFRRIAVDADRIANLDEFVARCEKRIASANGIPEGAAIELSLAGVAPFRRQDVPVENLKAAVEARFSPLTVRVANHLVPPGLVSVRHGERMRREEIEQQVIQQLVAQQGEYRDRAAAMTRLIQEVKSMAVEKTLPASIADHVQSRLAEMESDSSEAVPVGMLGGPPLGASPTGVARSNNHPDNASVTTALPARTDVPPEAAPVGAAPSGGPPDTRANNQSEAAPVTTAPPACTDVPPEAAPVGAAPSGGPPNTRTDNYSDNAPVQRGPLAANANVSVEAASVGAAPSGGPPSTAGAISRDDGPTTGPPTPPLPLDLRPILPIPLDEPEGGEAPCMAHLFEDW